MARCARAARRKRSSRPRRCRCTSRSPERRWSSMARASARPVARDRDQMRQSIGLVSLVVRDYDEAIAFYVGKLGFALIEDTYVPEQDKRWVVVAPPGATE